MTDEAHQTSRSWLERISQALLGEPKDKEQLIALLHDAQSRALMDSSALSMIEGVLHVSEMHACEIMLPRAKMIVIEKDMGLDEILPIVIESAHSRFPVIGDSKDEVLGILLAKDLLTILTQDKTTSEKSFNIKDFVRPATIIPEGKRLDVLLNDFKENRNHLAIVVDEYGSVAGMVTIEDVLEQIVGEIEDEYDVEEEDRIIKHNETNFSVKALTPIGEFNDYFNTQLCDEEFDTIGGLVLQGFGHLPTRGEVVHLANMEITILKANDRRIQEIGINLAEPQPEVIEAKE